MAARLFSILLAFLSLAPLTGCNIAGGGGTVHVPPPVIQYGMPTLLRYELSVWGGGNARKDYTDIQCHYRAANSKSFSTISGSVVDGSDKRVVVVFTLPALSTSDGGYVEYYFDEKFDGVYNKRNMEHVPLK